MKCFCCCRFAGILSAYGMALADVVHEQQEPCAKVYKNGMVLLKKKMAFLFFLKAAYCIHEIKILRMKEQSTNIFLFYK